MKHEVALRPHVTDGSPCWCGPEVLMCCPECEPDFVDEHCWRCSGRGLVPHDGYDDTPSVTVHNTEDLTCLSCGRTLCDETWPIVCECGDEYWPMAEPLPTWKAVT